MEVLGVAANVVAVVELSAKIASICFQYLNAVKDAKRDIEFLQKEMNIVHQLFQNVDRHHQRPEGSKLLMSQELANAVNECLKELQNVENKLEEGQKKPMHRFGLRSFKWPFKSKELQNIIQRLERKKGSVSLALSLDQRTLTINLNQKIDLSKLPTAKGAAFDSHEDEHDPACLPGTRVQLLEDVAAWADQSKPIFWLSGMAGTGKSTVSRTVAKAFAKDQKLGASFFFKRGGGDRGNASRFFTTIAAQLAIRLPEIAPYISRAIEEDPAIPGKALRDQFDSLIYEPLSKLKHSSEIFIVVDALDECEREEDIKAILKLLAQTKDINALTFRIFVTSRPELPIRLGFRKISQDTYQNVVLHEIEDKVIEHDISIFFQHEFSSIRDDRSLPPDWPGEAKFQQLVTMSIPLFIFAATVCRFIADPHWSPADRLAKVLQYQTGSHTSKLQNTYLPVLDQLLIETDDLEELIAEFKEIVGSIILLETPLSTASLADILGISQETVDCRLESLHSVLSIPSSKDSPVRLFHLSFRDFLLDKKNQKKTPLWVDEAVTHKIIAMRCIKFMSQPGRLREDICSLSGPGTRRAEVGENALKAYIAEPVRYACRYWVHHLDQAKEEIHEWDDVLAFFHTKFLYWIEAMSLMELLDQAIEMINSLLLITKSKGCEELNLFLADSKRFIFKNRHIIDLAPLQLYSSALIFSPITSIVRRTFINQVPKWIRQLPIVQDDWDATHLVLEGHSKTVNDVAFSPDNKLLATASADTHIKVWNIETGGILSTLAGNASHVSAISFSSDGLQLASVYFNKVIIWNLVDGQKKASFDCTGRVLDVAFSEDNSEVVAITKDNAYFFGSVSRTMSLDSLDDLHDVKAGRNIRYSVSINNSNVAILYDIKADIEADSAIRRTKTVVLYDLKSGSVDLSFKDVPDYSSWVSSIGLAFSHDGLLLAAGMKQNEIQIWDIEKKTIHSRLLDNRIAISAAITFSSNGLLASGSDSGSSDPYSGLITIWQVASSTLIGTIQSLRYPFLRLVFSPEGRFLASTSQSQTTWINYRVTKPDYTVRVWDLGPRMHVDKDRLSPSSAIGFSPDGKLLVSVIETEILNIWDSLTGKLLGGIKGSNIFSPDGWFRTMTEAPYDTPRIEKPGAGNPGSSILGNPTNKVQKETRVNANWKRLSELLIRLQTDFEVSIDDIENLSNPFGLSKDHLVQFSPDGQFVTWIAKNHDLELLLWHRPTMTIKKLSISQEHRQGFWFSPDNRWLAFMGINGLLLWDLASWKLVQSSPISSKEIINLKFSSDGHHLVAMAKDGSITIYNITTTRCTTYSPDEITPGKFYILSAAFSPSGHLLAYKNHRTDKIHLRNLLDGSHTTFEATSVNHVYHFSNDGSYLVTDRGQLNVHWTDMSKPPPNPPLSYKLFVDTWIRTEKSGEVLWLPPDFRPGCVSIYEKRIAVSSESREVIFIELGDI